MRVLSALTLALTFASCTTDSSESGPPVVGAWRVASAATIPTVDAAPMPHTVTRRPTTLGTAGVVDHVGHPIVATSDRLLLLDDLNGQMVALDRTKGEVLWRLAVGQRPDRLVLRADGAAILTVSGDGDVVLVSPDGKELKRTHLGPEPRGLALTADGALVHVALGASNAVVSLDALTLVEQYRTATPGAVEHVAFSGKLLVAAGPGGETWNIDASGSSAFSPLRTDSPFDEKVRPGRSFLVTANRVAGLAAQPDTGELLAVHQQSMPGKGVGGAGMGFAVPFPPEGEDSKAQGKDAGSEDPDAMGGYGGGLGAAVDPRLVRPVETAVTNLAHREEGRALPVRDPVTKLSLTATVAQPSDIVHSPTHTMALVSGLSSDTVLAIDTSPDVDPMASPIAVIDVGQAPRGVAFAPDGRWAYTLDSHSLSVSAIDLDPILTAPTITSLTDPSGEILYDSPCQGTGACREDWIEPLRLNRTRVVTFGTDPSSPAVRSGRRLFTYVGTPGVTKNVELACASCHPAGRQDGLVWDVPEGPRQTPSLAGRLHDTAPFNWNGSQPTLEDNMVRTVERMGGHGLTAAQRSDVAAFLETLPAPVAPIAPELSATIEAQERGRLVFTDPLVGCATCHVGEATTDGKSHDVGTGSGPEDRLFDTPSLRGLFYTAPYLHNGSAATLDDVLWFTLTTMGNASGLTTEERQDLVAYLLTL